MYYDGSFFSFHALFCSLFFIILLKEGSFKSTNLKLRTREHENCIL